MSDESRACITKSTKKVKVNEKSIGEPCNQFILTSSLRMGIIAGSVRTYKNRINGPSPSKNQLRIARIIIANEITSTKMITKLTKT